MVSKKIKVKNIDYGRITQQKEYLEENVTVKHKGKDTVLAVKMSVPKGIRVKNKMKEASRKEQVKSKLSKNVEMYA